MGSAALLSSDCTYASTPTVPLHIAELRVEGIVLRAAVLGGGRVVAHNDARRLQEVLVRHDAPGLAWIECRSTRLGKG
jgi:hypothetical protein